MNTNMAPVADWISKAALAETHAQRATTGNERGIAD